MCACFIIKIHIYYLHIYKFHKLKSSTQDICIVYKCIYMYFIHMFTFIFVCVCVLFDYTIYPCLCADSNSKFGCSTSSDVFSIRRVLVEL